MKTSFNELVRLVTSLTSRVATAVSQAAQLKAQRDGLLVEVARLQGLLDAAQVNAMTDEELLALDDANTTLAVLDQDLSDSNTVTAPAN